MSENGGKIDRQTAFVLELGKKGGRESERKERKRGREGDRDR